MEDDDEFGDLYTDVLLPFQSSSAAAADSAAPPPIDLSPTIGDGNIANSDLPPRQSSHPLAVDPQIRAAAVDFDRNSAGSEAVEEEVDFGAGSRVSELVQERGFQDPSCGDGGVGDLMDKDMKFDIEEVHGDVGSEQMMIPGLSGLGGGEGDDWDSDSEDDLQIVLNDSNHGPMAMERGEDDDEDGDGLVIVADGDVNQAMEEREWGEDGLQGAADGERKEAGEAGKANNGGMAMMAPKVGYSSHGHGYHPFHSQFKYVRPGAAPIPGSNPAIPGGAPGQVRPLVNIAPIAGRGRGEWRPTGQIRPPMQKSFHPGFGAAAWGGGRGFGGGLDFTLPSHKTIFDVDIDSFEEKPWKYPGIDISDYFNFGLSEESWKDYCKQLEQLRLESTMQSKIRVYESGRTDQDYDPDLPPELAAASGVHDVAAGNVNNVKSDVDQSDCANGSARMRPPLPSGRAIQVETGYGERLPSVDTRPPRVRDSDAIIEIVCQDPMDDDSSTGNEVPDQPNKDPSREDLRGDEAEEDTAPAENEYFNGRRMPLRNSVCDSMPEGGRVLPFPPEAPPRGHPRSRSHTPVYSDGNFGSSHEDRRTRVRTRDKRFVDNQKEESVESMDSKRSPALSSPIDCKEAVLDDPATEDGNSEVEKESSDMKNTNGTVKDGNSLEKRRLSSRVEPPVQETDDGEEEEEEEEEGKAARSSENSKARSTSSRDIDGEFLQDGRGKRRHLDENEKSSGRKDVEERRGVERIQVAPKPRDDPYSHLRDDPLNRRIRAEGSRKREHGEEIASRHGGKVRESERSEKDEYLNSRKQSDNGHYRAPYDKDASSRHRERDDNLKSRHLNADEYSSKRRKDKEEITHDLRENSSSRKRERDDQPRTRESVDNRHSDRTVRQKEREDWHKQKQPREESLSKPGREEGRSTSRSRRGAEEKARVVHAREKEEYKGSEKEHQSIDTSRHSEQPKRRNRMEDESLSHHKGREDVVHARGNQKSSSRAAAGNVSESQRVHERRNKESAARKSRDLEGGDQNTSKTHVDETGARGKSEQNKPLHHSSRKRKATASSDDEQQDSRRGCSKLERWASHKEKDFDIHSKSSIANNNVGSSEAIKHPDAPAKPISRHASVEDGREQEIDEKPMDDRHLDTVEKLKKRSERFKLPMPIEKETSTAKRTTETEASLPSTKSEASVADPEIKPERPPRKRRWISQNLK